MKFTRGVPRERRVILEVRRDDPWGELLVRDTGPGIPREDLGRVFEPFFRGQGTSKPGTGIGLATVQRIAQAHGGNVEVESTVGRGSLFKVRLPLASAAGPVEQ